MLRIAALGVLLLCASGCGLIGPSCTDRQNRGPVTTVRGDVAPGQLVSHRVPYGTEGSQNDAQISWEEQSTAGGPRISVYATKVACEDFKPQAATSSASCSVLGSAGSTNGQIATTLIVTNGRGNPDVLGSPAEYRLWVVGDPEQSARYTIDITWFYGPDC